jgi:Leucine-rich repeat (LRR) protein
VGRSVDRNNHTELGELVSLEYLHINNNQLTGTITTELGELVSLEYLYINDNQLTGTIPSELGHLC